MNETEENSDDHSENTEVEDEEDEEEEEDGLKEVVHERILERMQEIVKEHKTLLKELFFLKNGGEILDLNLYLKKPTKLLRKFLDAESLQMVGALNE